MLTTMVADRPEDLVETLADALSVAPADTSTASLFTPEWVSVPSLGLGNWLREQLSRRLGADGHDDGISANIDYPFPGALRWAVLDAHRAALGARPDVADPWRVERLVWSLLEVLSDPPDDLDERLAARPPGVTLAGRAGPLADLFDQYVVHRPEMVLEWLAGHDVGADLGPIDPAKAWQPALFRAVQRHIDTRHHLASTPAERLVEALERVRDGSLELGSEAPRPLPPRLFVVGQSQITAELGPVLRAVAEHRDVTLLLLSPSARSTVEIARRTAQLAPTLRSRAATWAVDHSVLQSVVEVDHPLLVTWAHRPFDTAVLLGAGGEIPTRVPPAADTDLPETRAGAAGASSTLLGRLQHDLGSGALGGTPFVAADRDRSVQLHGAPGPTRQVEVLRDTILGLLRDDPTLTEGDIAVLCPQLDDLAPVLTAVLGPPAQPHEQSTDGAVPSLRYSVVDRSARSFNPVLDGLAALLELLPGRFDATSVRGFLALAAVRERFGLSSEDLDLAGDWVDASRIRWGLDRTHRQRWHVEGDEANSWRSGLDQLLMGVALGDDLRDVALPGVDAPHDPVAEHALAPGGVAPLSLADGDLAGAGRLAAALHGLSCAHDRLVLGGARPVADWCDDLSATLDELFAAERFADWQRSRIDELLVGLRLASCTGGRDDSSPSDVALELADVRRLLAPALEGARTRADLGYGSVVFARPSLLQAVPYRVVCVLGLDGEALPSARKVGDDLLHLAPMVGDRDARAEARAELLAAIGAARDTLVITFNSTDVRTNTAVPEAVVLDELVEVLAATLGTTPAALRRAARHTDPAEHTHGAERAEGSRTALVTQGVVVHHPRQAFDPANFTSDDAGRPVGFDPVALRGARALQGPPHVDAGAGAGVLLDEPLRAPEGAGGVVELAELRDFFRHPVRSFFRRRLDVVVPERGGAADVELPTTLERLDRSWIGRQLVRVGLQRQGFDGLADGPGGGAADLLAVLDSARARGLLPPESLAADELDELCAETARLLDAADRLDVCRPATVTSAVDVVLDHPTRLVGTVTGCVDGGLPGPVRVGYGRPKPHWRVLLAIDLFALTLADPTIERRAVLVARAESTGTLEPVALAWRVAGGDPAARSRTASAALVELAAIRARGLCLPLPLFDGTSFALATGGDSKKAWGQLRGDHAYRDAADRYHQLAFGPLDHDELLELDVAGHTARGEAHRLWDTLQDALDTEELEPADTQGGDGTGGDGADGDGSGAPTRSGR